MKMVYSVTEELLELESFSDMTFDHHEEVKQENFIGRMSGVRDNANRSTNFLI